MFEFFTKCTFLKPYQFNKQQTIECLVAYYFIKHDSYKINKPRGNKHIGSMNYIKSEIHTHIFDVWNYSKFFFV